MLLHFVQSLGDAPSLRSVANIAPRFASSLGVLFTSLCHWGMLLALLRRWGCSSLHFVAGGAPRFASSLGDAPRFASLLGVLLALLHCWGILLSSLCRWGCSSLRFVAGGSSSLRFVAGVLLASLRCWGCSSLHFVTGGAPRFASSFSIKLFHQIANLVVSMHMIMV